MIMGITHRVPQSHAVTPVNLWLELPESVLCQVLYHVSFRDVVNCSSVCHTWNRVSSDHFLWRYHFYNYWKIDRRIPMAPGGDGWLSEFIRLYTRSPVVEVEELKHHTDQVNHVAFSNNGKMFSTCSKDGFVRVWLSVGVGALANGGATLKHLANMKKYTWQFTQFSQFNSNDSLLLVSGVHIGHQSTSGEIVVFNLKGEFALQSRVLNKPHDVFGTWITDSYLLSGNFHVLTQQRSCSVLWLNKATQEIKREDETVVLQLFKFINQAHSAVRSVKVVNNSLVAMYDSMYTGVCTPPLEEMPPHHRGTLCYSYRPVQDVDVDQQTSNSYFDNSAADTFSDSAESYWYKKKTATANFQLDMSAPADKKFSSSTPQSNPDQELDGESPGFGYVFDQRANRTACEVLTRSLSQGASNGRDGSEHVLSADTAHVPSSPSSSKPPARRLISADQLYGGARGGGGGDRRAVSGENDRNDIACLHHSTSRSSIGCFSDCSYGGRSYSSDIQCSDTKQEEKYELFGDLFANDHTSFEDYEKCLAAVELERESGVDEQKQNLSDTSVAKEEGENSDDCFSVSDEFEVQTNENNSSSNAAATVPIAIPDFCDGRKVKCDKPSAADSYSTPKAQRKGLEYNNQMSNTFFSNNSDLSGGSSSIYSTTLKASDNVAVPLSWSLCSNEVLELEERHDNIGVGLVQVAKSSWSPNTNTASSPSSSSSSLCTNISQQHHHRHLHHDYHRHQSDKFDAISCAENASVVATISSKTFNTDGPMVPQTLPYMANSVSKVSTSTCPDSEDTESGDVDVDLRSGELLSGYATDTEGGEGESALGDDMWDMDSVNFPIPRTTLTHNPSRSFNFPLLQQGRNILLGQSREEEPGPSFVITESLYLLFTLGSRVCIPHELGLKRISSEMTNVSAGSVPSRDNEHEFDDVDHVIPFDGHIVGYALSPDHRYAYVNVRKWLSDNPNFEDPLEPPPISTHVSLHVIDLVTQQLLPVPPLSGHKAYTPAFECLFLFVDVSTNFVASGAENKQGYIWDRHYQCIIGTLPHSDVVSAVAFNPCDEEMAVTVSDDHTVKIWRSRNQVRKINKKRFNLTSNSLVVSAGATSNLPANSSSATGPRFQPNAEGITEQNFAQLNASPSSTVAKTDRMAHSAVSDNNTPRLSGNGCESGAGAAASGTAGIRKSKAAAPQPPLSSTGSSSESTGTCSD